jgi:hypothetical protein
MDDEFKKEIEQSLKNLNLKLSLMSLKNGFLQSSFSNCALLGFKSW